MLRFYPTDSVAKPFRGLIIALLVPPTSLLLSATPPAVRPQPTRPAPAADSVACHLRGRVLDAYTQEPLPFASLWLKRLDQGTQSDEQGYFEFELTATQLDSVLTDTLQAQAQAFRRQAQPVSFRQLRPDSVLQLTLLRDPTVTTSAPLLVRDARRNRARPQTANPAAAAATAPRRTFWQRLFGGRQ